MPRNHENNGNSVDLVGGIFKTRTIQQKQMIISTKWWKTWLNITKKRWSAMRIDSGEGRSSLTPFILLPSSLLLTAPPLLAPRWVAKLFRLRRKSSLRPSAPSSLVALGGGREERRAGRRRTGQVGALSLLQRTSPLLFGLPLQTVLQNHHSLGENHALFNNFYYP